MTSSATSTPDHRPAPTARDDVPQVEHSTRRPSPSGGGDPRRCRARRRRHARLRRTTPTPRPTRCPAVAVAGPVAAYVVGDASHGGPGRAPMP